MGFFSELRERRLVQILLSYGAVAWIALEVVSQLVEQSILPRLVYVVLLVWVVGGFVATMILGWYHGEKGNQAATRGELAMLAVVALATLGGSWQAARAHMAGLERETALADVGSRFDANRIAVLWFEDRTDDPELAFVADALTEGLADELDAVPALEVVSTNGLLEYRDSSLPGDSIARLFDAGTFVRGSVAIAGSGDDRRLRVEAALVDAESGATLERAAFDRPADEVLALQGELSTEVSRFLRPVLGQEVRLRQSRIAANNEAAWVLVQRAQRARRQAQDHLAADDIDAMWAAYDAADTLLATAEATAPRWSTPPAVRARYTYEQARMEDSPEATDRVLAVALDHAGRALALDPRDAEALEVRGTIRYLRWLLVLEPDPDRLEALLAEAEADLTAATDVEPDRATAWNVLAHLYYQKDDIAQANLTARRAYEADAYLSSARDILWRLWSTSYDLENRTQSRDWCAEGRRRFPDDARFYQCRLWNMTSGAVEPDIDEAWGLLTAVVERTPEPERDLARMQMQTLVAGALARASMPDSARAVLARSEASPDLDPSRELLVSQAFVRTLLGDASGAVDLLGRYLTFNPERRAGFAEHGHWWWRDLRGDPAFQTLVGG